MLVSMNREGRLTVPAAARRELGLAGEAQFQLEVQDGKLVLQPAVVIPREDLWAYTPQNVAKIRRAQRDIEEGRVRQITEAELDRLVGDEG